MFFKKLFANKSIGYYMAAGIAALALITAILFIATQEGNMGNYAAGVGPETIGVFLLAGFVVELVALFLPQYRFIHIVALAMFGLAFYKETIIIPDFIAGKINNVEYNGGNYELNMFYLIALAILVIAAIAVSFLGFYKDEKEAMREMNLEKNNLQKIVRVGVGAVVVIAAVLTTSLVSNRLTNGVAQKTVTPTSSSSEKISRTIPHSLLT